MKKKSLLFTTLLCAILSSFSQQNHMFEDLIKEKMITHEVDHYPEKVFIHTDKDTYLSDEDIWFSAYLVNGITHRISQKSVVLYAELIDPENKIIDKKKILMNKLQGAGDFKLNKKAKTGIYTIRAYTNYMRNFENSKFFQKKITVFASSSNQNFTDNETETNVDSQQIKAKKPKVTFYPEGGYMVNELRSKIAVKIHDASLDSVSNNFTVVDEVNLPLTSFKTFNRGLGMFYLTPKASKKYYALLTLGDKVYKYKLPETLTHGYTLHTNKNRNNLVIKIDTNLPNGIFGSTLVVHQRGRLIFTKTLKETGKIAMLKISRKTFTDGVIQITLFNPENNPVCERLAFISDTVQKTIVDLKTEKEYYGSRKKVTLSVDVKNSFKERIASNVSLTVKDVKLLANNDNTGNIKTWLLLNSDIKGTIKNPNFFFKKDSNKTKEKLLDLVMLTQGWRGFTWQKVLFKNYANLDYEIEKGIMIRGRTTENRAPYKNVPATTRLTFKYELTKKIPTKRNDHSGEFSYGPYIFFNKTKISVEARLTNFKSDYKPIRNINVKFSKSTKSPEVLVDALKNSQSNNLAYLKNYKNYLNELEALFKAQENVLNEIKVKTKLITEEEKKEEKRQKEQFIINSRYTQRRYAFNNQYSSSLYTRFVHDDYNNYYNNDNNYYNNTIPWYYRVSPNARRYSFQNNRNFAYFATSSGCNLTKLRYWGSSDCASSLFPEQNDSYRKRYQRKAPGITNISVEGFYKAKEFYRTDHENGLEEQTKADIRTTLHWVPTLKLHKEGKRVISFFTADVKSEYLIEVQGITETGVPIYKTVKVMVE